TFPLANESYLGGIALGSLNPGEQVAVLGARQLSDATSSLVTAAAVQRTRGRGSFEILPGAPAPTPPRRDVLRCFIWLGHAASLPKSQPGHFTSAGESRGTDGRVNPGLNLRPLPHGRGDQRAKIEQETKRPALFSGSTISPETTLPLWPA